MGCCFPKGKVEGTELNAPDSRKGKEQQSTNISISISNGDKTYETFPDEPVIIATQNLKQAGPKLTEKDAKQERPNNNAYAVIQVKDLSKIRRKAGKHINALGYLKDLTHVRIISSRRSNDEHRSLKGKDSLPPFEYLPPKEKATKYPKTHGRYNGDESTPYEDVSERGYQMKSSSGKKKDAIKYRTNRKFHDYDTERENEQKQPSTKVNKRHEKERFHKHRRHRSSSSPVSQHRRRKSETSSEYDQQEVDYTHRPSTSSNESREWPERHKRHFEHGKRDKSAETGRNLGRSKRRHSDENNKRRNRERDKGSHQRSSPAKYQGRDKPERRKYEISNKNANDENLDFWYHDERHTGEGKIGQNTAQGEQQRGSLKSRQPSKVELPADKGKEQNPLVSAPESQKIVLATADDRSKKSEAFPGNVPAAAPGHSDTTQANETAVPVQSDTTQINENVDANCGCVRRTSGGTLIHSENCLARMLECPATDCKRLVHFQELLNHINQFHTSTRFLGETEFDTFLTEYWNIRNQNLSNKNCQWTLSIWRFDNHDFAILFEKNDGKWYNWVYVLDGKDVAEKYEGEIRLVDFQHFQQSSPRHFRGVVRAVDEKAEDIRKERNGCLTLTDDDVRTYMTAEGITDQRKAEGYDYRLPVQYKIFKRK